MNQFISPRQAVIALLKECAEKGLRCPSNPEIGTYVRALGFKFLSECQPSSLARQGILRTEVYGHNWRVIEIGGKRTKEAPAGQKPYLIIDVRGKRKMD